MCRGNLVSSESNVFMGQDEESQRRYLLFLRCKGMSFNSKNKIIKFKNVVFRRFLCNFARKRHEFIPAGTKSNAKGRGQDPLLEPLLQHRRRAEGGPYCQERNGQKHLAQHPERHRPGRRGAGRLPQRPAGRLLGADAQLSPRPHRHRGLLLAWERDDEPHTRIRDMHGLGEPGGTAVDSRPHGGAQGVGLRDTRQGHPLAALHHRVRQASGPAFGRTAQARGAGQHPHHGARHAHPRRTDEPPRPADDRVARELPLPFQHNVADGDARPLLPGPHLFRHPRDGRRDHLYLSRQLCLLSRAACPAARGGAG